jgi:hypothetical protein
MLPADLMLLFLDDETGLVLVELVGSGRVAFENDGRKVVVVGPTPLEDEFLQKSLTRLDKPMESQRAVVARAREIAGDDWAAQAVELAMDGVSRMTSWRIVASEMTAASIGGSS